MKKIWSLASMALLLAACSSSPQTGGAQADSGSVGNSGAADPATTNGAPGASAASNGSSDTSKPKVADTAKYEHNQKKPQ